MKISFFNTTTFEEEEVDFLKKAPQHLARAYLSDKNDIPSTEFKSLLKAYKKMLK